MDLINQLPPDLRQIVCRRAIENSYPVEMDLADIDVEKMFICAVNVKNYVAAKKLMTNLTCLVGNIDDKAWCDLVAYAATSMTTKGNLTMLDHEFIDRFFTLLNELPNTIRQKICESLITNTAVFEKIKIDDLNVERLYDLTKRNSQNKAIIRIAKFVPKTAENMFVLYAALVPAENAQPTLRRF